MTARCAGLWGGILSPLAFICHWQIIKSSTAATGGQGKGGMAGEHWVLDCRAADAADNEGPVLPSKC